jgi:hypothetical protein
MQMSEEQLRDEVHRRFQVWEWHGTPARRYALLVAGYFRTRGPFYVEGEEKYLRLPSGVGLRLVEWVEVSADRRLTSRERAEVTRVIASVREGIQQRSSRFAISPGLSYNRFQAAECLPLAFDRPHLAAARLILNPDAIRGESHLNQSPPQYRAVNEVMDCLCPTSWNGLADWIAPQEAVAWAQRMYDERDFSTLPILADRLEDAGCPDRLLLDHCRRRGPHYRGCAAVDRVLLQGSLPSA